MAEYAEQRSKIFCEEEQEYIFDMFYKGDPTQKESYGLGLYVSKQILEAHGSRMCFYSVPGEGSTFWFELPAGSRAI